MPGADQAIVDETKLRSYLLSFEHPVGRSKARFFAALGFHEENWEELQTSLLAIASDKDAALGARNQFGQKYVVRGTIKGPLRNEAMIETVWIVLTEEAAPRFVTAYPGDKE
jgi:hypothetical protein